MQTTKRILKNNSVLCTIWGIVLILAILLLVYEAWGADNERCQAQCVVMNCKLKNVTCIIQSGFENNAEEVFRGLVKGGEVLAIPVLRLCPGFHVVIWRMEGVTIMQSFDVKPDTRSVYLSQGAVLQKK